MRRSRFLSLSRARPPSEPLPIGGHQLPDSSAFCPSMCNSIHILTCKHKWTNRPHYAARILQHGNGVVDSCPRDQEILTPNWGGSGCRWRIRCERSSGIIFRSTSFFLVTPSRATATLKFVARNCHICPNYLEPFQALTSLKSTPFAMSDIPAIWKFCTVQLTDCKDIPTSLRIR